MPIEADLITRIHTDSQGRMRLVMNAIATIEQLAQANSWKRVSAANVAGKPLVVEFKGRQLGRRTGGEQQ